jgi:hypothetical protein
LIFQRLFGSLNIDVAIRVHNRSAAQPIGGN